MPSLRLLPELEEELRQLSGIIAASVVTGPDASPLEIHVLAEPGKPAKQLVRDVQSYALARHGIEIDHRIVSVVQLGVEEVTSSVSVLRDDPESSVEDVAPRVVISEIAVRTAGAESEASVTLTHAGAVFEGRLVGPSAHSVRARLVAGATLQALSELLGATADVESATVLDNGTHAVAVVVLSVMVPRFGEQTVSGSAVVRGDESDAVARAVLDALNRRLGG